MTKEEKFKWCFQMIAAAAKDRSYISNTAAKRFLRDNLDELKELLQEPEPKSGTIVRLTEENRKLKEDLREARGHRGALGKDLRMAQGENRDLKRDLAEANANLDAAERPIENLQKKLVIRTRQLERTEERLEWAMGRLK